MIIGITPRIPGYDRLCERKRTKFPFISCGRDGLSSTPKATNNKLIKYLKSTNSYYVDFNDILCTSNICTSRIDDVPMYYDSVHLSVAGSEKLGRLSILRSGIINIFVKFINN